MRKTNTDHTGLPNTDDSDNEFAEMTETEPALMMQ